MANQNTSATGGILSSDITPLTKAQIEDILYKVIAGITGYEEPNLFVAYQFVPPSAPKMETDWAAFYVRPTVVSNLPQFLHDSRGEGADVIIEEYGWELRVSFFGPNAVTKASALRAGLFVEQNRWDTMVPHNVEVTYVGSPKYMPYLENQKWLQRVDLEVRLTQIAYYRYPVLNVLSGNGEANSDVNVGVTFDSNNARKKE